MRPLATVERELREAREKKETIEKGGANGKVDPKQYLECKIIIRRLTAEQSRVKAKTLVDRGKGMVDKNDPEIKALDNSNTDEIASINRLNITEKEKAKRINRINSKYRRKRHAIYKRRAPNTANIGPSNNANSEPRPRTPKQIRLEKARKKAKARTKYKESLKNLELQMPTQQLL